MESAMLNWMRAGVFVVCCSPYGAAMLYSAFFPESILSPLWWAAALGTSISAAVVLTWFLKWDDHRRDELCK